MRTIVFKGLNSIIQGIIKGHFLSLLSSLLPLFRLFFFPELLYMLSDFLFLASLRHQLVVVFRPEPLILPSSRAQVVAAQLSIQVFDDAYADNDDDKGP